MSLTNVPLLSVMVSERRYGYNRTLICDMEIVSVYLEYAINYGCQTGRTVLQYKSYLGSSDVVIQRNWHVGF
jgi:hypothetical protein